MTTMLSSIFSPAGLLGVFILLTQATNAFYSSRNVEPSAASELLKSMILLGLLGWWLERDSRERGVALFYCRGVILSVAWPLVLPVYLYRTRGVKGLLHILAFAGAYVAANLLGLLIFFLLDA